MSEADLESVQLDNYRFYKVGDNYYPSVTTILSEKFNPALMKWKKSLSPAQIQTILDYTSVRGEIVHYLALQHYETEQISQGNSPDDAIDIVNENDQMRSEVYRAINLFNSFQDSYKLEAKFLERAVFNHEYQYAGRVDFCGWRIDRENGLKHQILMDIKTSRQIHTKSVSLQLGAYNYAIDDWASELWVLLLHPGASKVDGLAIGTGNGHWQFKQVDNDFATFTYYEMLFRPKAHKTLRNHRIKK